MLSPVFGDPRLPSRFWEKVRVDEETGCWRWLGATSTGGYGRFGSYRVYQAHRVSFEALVGPIGEGLQLDHLCRTRGCVNPAHLEPVTQQENIRRGTAGAVVCALQRSKTHCPAGHPYDEANTRQRKGERTCRACARARRAARLAAGLCACKRPIVPGRTRCAECAAKNAATARRSA